MKCQPTCDWSTLLQQKRKRKLIELGIRKVMIMIPGEEEEEEG